MSRAIQEGCLALDPTIDTKKLTKKVSDRIFKIMTSAELNRTSLEWYIKIAASPKASTLVTCQVNLNVSFV